MNCLSFRRPTFSFLSFLSCLPGFLINLSLLLRVRCGFVVQSCPLSASCFPQLRAFPVIRVHPRASAFIRGSIVFRLLPAAAPCLCGSVVKSFPIIVPPNRFLSRRKFNPLCPTEFHLHPTFSAGRIPQPRQNPQFCHLHVGPPASCQNDKTPTRAPLATHQYNLVYAKRRCPSEIPLASAKPSASFPNRASLSVQRR